VLVALVIMRTTAALCCLPFTRMRLPTRRTLPAILAAGVFDATGWLLFILAERAGSLLLAALCIAQAPVVATLAAWLWLSERPPRLALFGIAGIVAGISAAAVIS